MLRLRQFLTFLTILLSIMGGVHFFLFRRLVVDTVLPYPWPPILAGVLVLAVLSIPASFVIGRRLERGAARLFVVPVYIWLGVVFQAFFLFLALDVIRIGIWLLGTLGVAVPPWVFSLPTWQWVATGGVALVLGATAFSIWWALTRLAVKRIEIPLPNLPAEMDGFTIAHLSDLHLDLVQGRQWLSSVVGKTNALRPDLIAITGDLAEGSVRQYGEEVTALKQLSAPHGVFFVTGNHEYFHDLQGWLNLLPEMGVRVLRNERVPIDSAGGGFDLAGVDDHDGGRINPDHGPDLGAALLGRNRERALVLLAHQPRIMEEAEKAGVDLVLSGHTHGGQIWPFSYLVYLQQPYVHGLKELNGTKLYLSAGTGFWGPPMRLGTTAEIALITLRAEA